VARAGGRPVIRSRQGGYGRPPHFWSKAQMPEDQKIPDRKLTEMQQRFVDCFTRGGEAAGNPGEAALAAGYAPDHAVEIGRQLLGKPHIVAAIDAALREAIGTRLTVQAVNVIESIIRNPDASLKLRGEMAVKVVEYSGLVERTKVEKAKQTGISSGCSLAEMTREELEEIVVKGKAVLDMAAETERQKIRLN
jgi:phage terminase small subunit